MNIKFEWLADTDHADYSLWLGSVNVGAVTQGWLGPSAWFGNEHRVSKSYDCKDLDEAKSWVESKAREWLKEVTADAL